MNAGTTAPSSAAAGATAGTTASSSPATGATGLWPARARGGTAASRDLEAALSADRVLEAALPADRFPHTRRPLPWILAAFLAILFFVPIASTELKVHLPVDSHIDRFFIVGLVLAWIWLGGDQRAFLGTRRSKLFVSAICIYLTLAVSSLLLDAPRIINLGDLKLSGKQFAVLLSFLVICWFVLTALRYEDVRGFASFLIGLGTMMAVGMIIERRTGYSIFFNWSAAILKPIAHVAPSSTNINPEFGSDGRVIVRGPTDQGLAAATMLVIVMPFALVRVLDATTSKSRWLNGIALALMLAGAAATDRKTALIVPVVVLIYVACYRPRQVLRMAPVGLVAVLAVVHLASPGAIGKLIEPAHSLQSNSTTHRLADFSTVTPDLLAHPVLGRGYGTQEPDNQSVFRVNDNEYIDQLIQVGIIGTLAYLWLILAPVFAAHGTIRRRAPAISSLALASAGGCVAFLVASALFDALSFPQAPYMFFIVAALATIAASGPEGNVRSLRELARGPLRRPRAAASS
jgi:hypothetical protein